MQNESYVVPPKVYRGIVDLLANKQKIQAIKLLRKEIPGHGLKDAKLAIDRMCDPSLTNHPRVVASPVIVAVTLDYGDGPIQVDLEEMQIRTLTQLPSIGIDACAHMLDLVDVFNAISEGKKVGIIDENIDEAG